MGVQMFTRSLLLLSLVAGLALSAPAFAEGSSSHAQIRRISTATTASIPAKSVQPETVQVAVDGNGNELRSYTKPVGFFGLFSSARQAAA